ncbi:MAG: hypothetical protein IT259_18975 [Saprospiraceae bacterium]|nr:hypothetical protein [Saprospiraceae bacterium]
MKNIAPFLLLLFAFAGVLQFCVKPPDYPDEPVITFKSLTKNTQFQSAIDDTDTLLVTLEFTDGDGDLGSAEKGNDISVIDTRDNSGDTLSLPLVEQQGAGNGISGTISFVLPPTCCIPPPLNGIPLPPCDPSVAPNFLRDTVIYKVNIRDRAGHVSNEVALPPIILICKQ